MAPLVSPPVLATRGRVKPTSVNTSKVLTHLSHARTLLSECQIRAEFALGFMIETWVVRTSVGAGDL